MYSNSLAVEELTEESISAAGLSEAKGIPPHGGPSKFRTILLALLVVCFNAVGNLSLAWGMKHLPEVGVNPIGYLHALLNPFVAGGVGLLILWLLTRMALMSWADLSFALPLMAIGYVVAAVLGRFVLHETVGQAQWAGTLLIFAGSVLVGTTHHQTQSPQARRHRRGSDD